MKNERREEVLLDAALDAARKDSSGGLDAMRARVVLRRIEAELAPKEKKRWMIPVVAMGSAAGAALVAIFMFFAGRADRSAPIAGEPQLAGQVVYRSGELAAAEVLEIAPAADLEIAAEARLDFVVPKKVRVAVHGPAKVARKLDGSIALSSGRASFSVDPHPKSAPFKVRALDAEVVVHGTKFDVDVKDGLLAQVRVNEGKVEVRKLDGSPSVFLTGGAALNPATATVSEATFDAPWWKHEERAAEGYLSAESTPSGATVTLDGEAIGTTPLLVLWKTGARQIAIAREGYRTAQTEISIEPGKISRVKVALVVLPREEDSVSEKRRPAKDPWKIARALLEAKKCKVLDRHIEQMLERAAGDADKARAEMWGAECHLRSGAKPRALAAYGHVYDVYTNTQSAEAALFEAAKLEAELGRPRVSLERIESYLARFSANGRFTEAATMRRCELLIELQHLGEARGCLENYRRVYPSGMRAQQAQLLLATIARIESRWEAAVELYREYLRQSPEARHAEEASYHLVACLKRGKLPGLEAAVADFLARFPNSKRAAEVARWK